MLEPAHFVVDLTYSGGIFSLSFWSDPRNIKLILLGAGMRRYIFSYFTSLKLVVVFFFPLYVSMF